MMPPASPSTGRRWTSIQLDGGYTDLPVGVEEDEEPERRITLADLYPDWHKQASCLGAEDVTFFGADDPDRRPQYNLTEISSARDICAECPVRRMCLTSALTLKERYGVWGNTTPKQRAGMFAAIDNGSSTVSEIVEDFFTPEEER